MHRQTPDTPDSPKRLIDTAYELLRSDIVQCRLKPGEQVSEAHLAQRYGLGKAPIRSALSRLCQERLVEPLARRGHRVARLTIRDVIDVFEMRIILEPKAARMAAGRIGGSVLDRLAEICRQEYRLGDPVSRAIYLQATYELHATIANASGNWRLAVAIIQHLDESQRIRHLGLAGADINRTARAQHLALLAAIREGDGDRAEAISHEHLQTARKLFVDELINHPSILDRDAKLGSA